MAEAERTSKAKAVDDDHVKVDGASASTTLLPCSSVECKDIEDIRTSCQSVTGRLPPIVPCYYPYRRMLEPGSIHGWSWWLITLP